MTKGMIIFRGEVPVGIRAPYMDIPGVNTITREKAVQVGNNHQITFFTIDAKDIDSFAQAAAGLVAKAGPLEHVIYQIDDGTPRV